MNRFDMDVKKMDLSLDQHYWDERYQTGQTGWDAGAVTTPLRAYFDQLNNCELKILIPGAGNAYEAAYLFENGFHNTHTLDISPTVIQRFEKDHPSFPKSNVHLMDFWEHEGAYDLIIEQTFFCALDPLLRTEYVRHMHQLLRPSGKLVGLLWNHPMNDDHPPFGGTVAAYQKLFHPFFHLEIMEPAYNSIAPRAGRELFIKMIRK